MRQLSALDAQFLSVESATTLGHVGGLLLLDSSTTPSGQLTLDDLRDLLEARLHLTPVLRQRLVEVPLGLGRPYWVDDPEFDLEFHLREMALPEPGTEQQLGEQVARLAARPLDRSRPLWEVYLISGVDGGRVAVYAKVHHAAIDGTSGAEILATIMDATAEPRIVEPPDRLWQPAPMPGLRQLVEQGLGDLAQQPGELLRVLPRSLPQLTSLPGAARLPGVQTIAELSATVVRLATGGELDAESRRRLLAPRTPLNGPITPHRRLAFGSVSLAEVKQVKDAFDLTVNDVVMAICTTALRRWLLDHDALPTVPIVAAVPVSVRAETGADASGNQISVMFAELPTHERDPLERLRLVHEAMTEAKQEFDEMPASLLQDLSTVVPAASGLAARALLHLVAAQGPPVNVFVSNLPGPQLPSYVAGARVLGIHPVSAVSDLTGGLNLTVLSYDGALDFGLLACRELVPDVWNVLGYLSEALDELLTLVPPSEPEPDAEP